MRRFDDLFKRLRLGDFDGDGDGDGGSSASDSRVHALRLRGSVITRDFATTTRNSLPEDRTYFNLYPLENEVIDRNEITRIIVLEDPLWDKDLSEGEERGREGGNDKGKTSRDFKKLFQRQLAVLHYCQPVSFFVPLIDVVELFFPVLQKNPEMRCSSSKKIENRSPNSEANNWKSKIEAPLA
ncbi:hypothetical protein V1477_008782 [Vespula maculifrons]|uniref:Uncharacterized protein n=1 Tax=Vespula maculifrons TaxID=7453 RepID=A0ABD2CE19_VESMC